MSSNVSYKSRHLLLTSMFLTYCLMVSLIVGENLVLENLLDIFFWLNKCDLQDSICFVVFKEKLKYKI